MEKSILKMKKNGEDYTPLIDKALQLEGLSFTSFVRRACINEARNIIKKSEGAQNG